MSIKIVTDSACDLPQDLVDKHDIQIVPLTIRFGTEEFVDRVELTTADFWNKCQTSSIFPQTAAPSPGAFESAFRKAKDDGFDEVICIDLSSKLSGTYQSAELAARSLQDVIPVHVVDSLSLTTGLGAILIRASEAARSGMSSAEIIDLVNELRTRTKIFAALDTLENLKKGGRIGGAQAFLGSLLSIKPIIEVSDGEVVSESKQRTRAQSLRYLANKVKAFGKVESLWVCGGAANDTDDLVALIKTDHPDTEIMRSDIGPVIGTHGGPGVIGVTFFTAN